MAGDREPTLGQLVSQATADVQSLIRDQVELTKVELSQSAKRAVGSSALLIGAGTLGFLSFIFLLVAAGYGLVAAGLSPWLAFLIVALVLLLVAGILGVVGRQRLTTIHGPERSIKAIEATRTALSHPHEAALGERTAS